MSEGENIMQYKSIDINDSAQLYTYILDAEISYNIKKRRPAIIICPGGGYLLHATKEGEAVATSFLNQGYHCFVLKYSTYYKKRVTDIDETPEINQHAQYPQQALELMTTMKIIHDHADQWMVDINNIFIVGFSAGGHLAATLGTHWNDKNLLNLLPFKIDTDFLKPKGLILGYPLLAGNAGEYIKQNAPEGDLIKHQVADINRCLFDTPDPSDTQMEVVDIVQHIDKNTPPTFLWITLTDKIVDPEASLEYIKQLHRSGVSGELHIFENGQHGLGRADEISAKTENDINTSVAQWLPLALKWLHAQIAK